ncbi:tRNA adenosine(34) deaminase TadA [Aurantivibrio plasticivorans]
MSELIDDQAQIDRRWMERALIMAKCAREQGEVPVGAVLVSADGKLLAEGWNRPISSCDPSAHAEIVVLRDAAKKLGNYRLPGATLYVTIEPCAMCAGALVHSRIARVVFGALEPKAGAVVSQLHVLDAPSSNHLVRYDHGVLEDQASGIMSDFFKYRREQRKQAKRAQQESDG